MFEHGTIKINQQLSGFQGQYTIDVDLTYKVRVYAFDDEVEASMKEALRELREAIMSDLEIDQDKLALVSDIPIEDLRSIKQRYRAGALYDRFGRVLFSGSQS